MNVGAKHSALVTLGETIRNATVPICTFLDTRAEIDFPR